MNDKKDPKKDDFDPYDFFKLEQPDNNDKKKDDKNKKGFPFWGILLLVLIGLTIADIFFLGKNNNQLPFSKFKEMVENGQIVEVEIGDSFYLGYGPEVIIDSSNEKGISLFKTEQKIVKFIRLLVIQ